MVKKIIIADDNRDFCQMLQSYLQGQEDLNIVGVAYNGLEAWELIQTREPDLIILDLVMPHLDGLGVLERLNARPSMKRPPIIMLTAFGQESFIRQVMNLGVEHLILKPFEIDILIKRIRSLDQDPPSSRLTHLSSTSSNMAPEGNNLNLSVEVTKVMNQIGIPAHVRGYQYIRDAILMVVEDVSLLAGVTN